MNIFVSYARRDHDIKSLRDIERMMEEYGNPYIDDLHGRDAVDRLACVARASSRAPNLAEVSAELSDNRGAQTQTAADVGGPFPQLSASVWPDQQLRLDRSHRRGHWFDPSIAHPGQKA